MAEPTKHSWHVIETLGVSAIAISPFWFMASDLGDLDEIKKTAVGGALVTVILAVLKFASRSRSAKKPDGKGDKHNDASGEQSHA